MPAQLEVIRDEPTVTVDISTKGRYFSTLSGCLMSIAGQSVLPNRLIICDDNIEPIDIREVTALAAPWKVLISKGVKVEVVYTKGQGQVRNHQLVLEKADTKYIYRIDDDCFAEANVLKSLVETIEKFPGCPAAGSLVIRPGTYPTTPVKCALNISDTLVSKYYLPNLQWFPMGPNAGGYIQSDHLYSSFVYSKVYGLNVGYPNFLSVIGHREETLFTYGLKKAIGNPCYINTQCSTWHFQEDGGIRSYSNKMYWDNDEFLFRKSLELEGIKPTKIQFFVLDNGMGDHLAFDTILPELDKLSPGYTKAIFCCYPDVFSYCKDKYLIGSIAEAYGVYNIDPLRYSIYRWMKDKNWQGTLSEAFLEMYHADIAN